MYPDTSPTTPVEVDHGHTMALVDQAAARPCRCAAKTIGYARTGADPADLRTAVIELGRLGVHSEHIYVDQAGDRSVDGLQLALRALNAGDTLAAASFARLGRSVAGLAQLVDQLDQLHVQLIVAGERIDTGPAARLLNMLALFQVELVDQAIAAADWTHRQRDDQRHPHHRVDAVQAVWLQQLFDAGMPRFQLGANFGVSRATVFRAAAQPANAV